MRNLFRLIREKFPGKKIGFPKIGAGLAGGDWSHIVEIIADELRGEKFTLVEYSKGAKDVTPPGSLTNHYGLDNEVLDSIIMPGHPPTETENIGEESKRLDRGTEKTKGKGWFDRNGKRWYVGGSQLNNSSV